MRTIFINIISLPMCAIGLYLIASAWVAADFFISTALSTGGLSALVVGWMGRQFFGDVLDAIKGP